MKTITLKNEKGATIKLKRNAHGEIHVQYSRGADKFAGEFREMDKVFQHPDMLELLEEHGIKKSDPDFKKAAKIFRGLAYVATKTGQMPISREDGDLIRGAISKLDLD